MKTLEEQLDTYGYYGVVVGTSIGMVIGIGGAVAQNFGYGNPFVDSLSIDFLSYGSTHKMSLDSLLTSVTLGVTMMGVTGCLCGMTQGLCYNISKVFKI